MSNYGCTVLDTHHLQLEGTTRRSRGLHLTDGLHTLVPLVKRNLIHDSINGITMPLFFAPFFKGVSKIQMNNRVSIGKMNGLVFFGKMVFALARWYLPF